jgi:hypothetical protein
MALGSTWVPGIFLGVKDGRHVRLTPWPPSMSRLCTKCGSHDSSQLHEPPWPVTGTAVSMGREVGTTSVLWRHAAVSKAACRGRNCAVWTTDVTVKFGRGGVTEPETLLQIPEQCISPSYAPPEEWGGGCISDTILGEVHWAIVLRKWRLLASAQGVPSARALHCEYSICVPCPNCRPVQLFAA